MTLKPVTAITLNEAERLYLSAVNAHGDDAPWLASLRKDAAEDFARNGLPHRRVETWKYTDLRSLDRAGFTPAEPGNTEVDPLPFEAGQVDEIVILNGFICEKSLQPERFKGIRVMSIRTALTEVPELLEIIVGGARPLDRSSLYALNLSLMNDGLVLIADKGASHPRPIVLRYVNDSVGATSVHIRNVIIAGEGAKFTLLENREEGTAENFVNVVTDLEIESRADINHYRLDQCSEESFTISLANANLDAEARYENIGLSLGGKAARIETQIRFSGEGSHAQLGGVLAGLGHDHIDHTTIASHDVPNCTCDEEFRAILTDNARGVFQGQISVAQDAQKTDSRMLMRGLLLSDNASMRAKPELEIYADDVKCAHGTSVGNIDEDTLFYMMSRGIPVVEARALLVEAFSKDVVETITDEWVREEFTRQLAGRLAKIVGDQIT